jgi:hypothetical protein
MFFFAMGLGRYLGYKNGALTRAYSKGYKCQLIMPHMNNKISIIMIFLISIILISLLSASAVVAATYCTNHAQCAKACSNNCPSSGYGCCVDGDLGQCNTKINECYCLEETSYCSSCPDCESDEYCDGDYNICKGSGSRTSRNAPQTISTSRGPETISGVVTVDELTEKNRYATATVESEVVKTYTLKQTLDIFEDAIDGYLDANSEALGGLISPDVLRDTLKASFKATYAGEMYDKYKNEKTAALFSGDKSSILVGFKRSQSLGIDLKDLNKGAIIKVSGTYVPLNAGENMLYEGYADDVAGRFTATQVEIIKQSSIFSRIGRTLLKIFTFGIVG